MSSFSLCLHQRKLYYFKKELICFKNTKQRCGSENKEKEKEETVLMLRVEEKKKLKIGENITPAGIVVHPHNVQFIFFSIIIREYICKQLLRV